MIAAFSIEAPSRPGNSPEKLIPLYSALKQRRCSALALLLSIEMKSVALGSWSDHEISSTPRGANVAEASLKTICWSRQSRSFLLSLKRLSFSRHFSSMLANPSWWACPRLVKIPTVGRIMACSLSISPLWLIPAS